MTFENISENAVLNAVGRLVDPGKKINMPVDYYAAHKAFMDNYVTAKTGKIAGMEEYDRLAGHDPVQKDDAKETDLMDEVIAEAAEAKAAEAKAAEAKAAKATEAAKAKATRAAKAAEAKKAAQ